MPQAVRVVPRFIVGNVGYVVVQAAAAIAAIDGLVWQPFAKKSLAAEPSKDTAEQVEYCVCVYVCVCVCVWTFTTPPSPYTQAHAQICIHPHTYAHT